MQSRLEPMNRSWLERGRLVRALGGFGSRGQAVRAPWAGHGARLCLKGQSQRVPITLGVERKPIQFVHAAAGPSDTAALRIMGRIW